MTGEETARAQQAHEQQVVDALLDGAVIEVPASLVEHELQHLAGDLAETLQRRGVTLQRYLEATKKTEEQLLDELRPGAERRVRTQLAIEEIARLEDLQPTGEEIDREVENVARRLQQDLPRVREWLAQQGRYDALVGALRRQKALDFLVKIARGDPSISTQGHPEPSREGDVA
jgi:trigger factor